MSAPPISVDSDASLVGRARAGDGRALETLLQRHAAAAAAMAYAITGNREDALDAAQAALLKLVHELRAGDLEGRPFRHCLYALAHGAAVDLLRQNANRKQREQRVAAARETHMPGPMLEREEMLTALRQELQALPAQTATVLALHHLDGLSVSAVAVQTGLSVDACKQRLSRGRDELRGRLERRGLTLASLPPLPGLLDDLFGGANAFAAELSPADLARLMHPARSAAPARPSSSFPAETASSLESAHSLAQAPVGERKMSKAIVTLSLLLGVACMYFILKQTPSSNAAPEITAATDGARSQFVAVGKAHSAGGVTAPVSSAPAAQRAAPHWQSPRFIEGLLMPVAIAGAGSRATLLASQLMTPDRLQLFESRDGGENWSKDVELPGYVDAEVAITPAGTMALLGLVRAAKGPDAEDAADEDPDAAAKTTIDETTFARMDWRTRRADGQFTAPQAVWAAPADERLVCKPRLLPVDGGWWAFTQVESRQEEKKSAVIVSFADGLAAPANVCRREGAGPNGRGSGTLAAWAQDRHTAGVFLLTDKQLTHHVTRDGGKNWQLSAVPFDTQLGSSSPYQATPIGLAREGNHLVLLVRAYIPLGNTGDKQNFTTQCFTLSSNNLGTTWSIPFAAGRPDSNQSTNFHLELHAAHGEVGLVYDSWTANNTNDDGAAVKTTIMISSDGGDTWYNHHAFDAIGKASINPVIGGDNHSMHIAVMTLHGSLVIRSFTAADWNAPATPAPEWFKEQKLFEPTKEDF